MAAELQYPVVFEKLELKPKEYEKLLESKMIKLIDGVHSIGDLRQKWVFNSIKMVRKFFNPKAKTTNPNELDGRTTSRKTMVDEGVLKDKTTSPKKVQEDSKRGKRKQGETTFSKELGKRYHKEQIALFKEFKDQMVEEDLRWDNKGYLLNGNGDRLSAIEFCNKLDGITHKYMEILKNSTKSSKQEAELKRESLKKIYEPCKAVVLRRNVMECAVENDLMTDDGYKQWREHVWVLMTFAGLLVTIDALSKSPEYGGKSFVKSGLPLIRRILS